MIKNVYRRALQTLLGLPLRLWGISLLYMLISGLASTLAVVPILGIPLQLLLGLGMTGLYLRGIRGEHVSCEQLFEGFQGNLWRKLGGMAWMALWCFLWALIPLAGIVLGIIKGYAYRFTPYILMTRPEVPAMDALKLSMEETKGRKGLMFAADLLPGLAVAVCMLLLALLAQLPVIGFLFGLLLILLVILSIAFLPLLYGLIGAAFYEEVQSLAAAEPAAAAAAAAEPAAESSVAEEVWDSGAAPVPDPVPVPELPQEEAPETPAFEPVEPERPVPEAPPVPEFLPRELPEEPELPAQEEAPAEKRCPACGSIVGPGARFCRECGSPL